MSLLGRVTSSVCDDTQGGDYQDRNKEVNEVKNGYAH